MTWNDPNWSRRETLASHDNYYYKLTGGNMTVVLPKDLAWEDEFSWEPVAQVYEYSVEGNLLIQESTKKKGRHITLVGQNNMAWLDRQDMLTLIQMKNTAGLKMQFTFEPKGSTASSSLFSHTVMFRHQDTAIEYALVKNWDQYENDSLYIINAIRLMEVLPNQPTSGV